MIVRVRRRTWYSWKILLYPLYPTESHFMNCLMDLCNDLTWAWLRFFPVPHTWVSIFWIVSCFNFLAPLVLITTWLSIYSFSVFGFIISSGKPMTMHSLFLLLDPLLCKYAMIIMRYFLINSIIFSLSYSVYFRVVDFFFFHSVREKVSLSSEGEN